MKNTLEKCTSNDGTCGVKIGCLYSKIRQNCFSFLKTYYIDYSYDGGTAFAAWYGFFDVAELSMFDIVQINVLTHAAFLVFSSQCVVSRLSHSHSSMVNNGIHYMEFNFQHYKWFLLHVYSSWRWSCNMDPWSEFRAMSLPLFSSINSPLYLILNTESGYFIDDSMCFNNNANSSSPSPSAMSGWYFEKSQNVGSVFVNKLSTPILNFRYYDRKMWFDEFWKKKPNCVLISEE